MRTFAGNSRLRTAAFAVTAVLLMTLSGKVAASDRLDISGYLKNYSSAIDPPEIGSDPTGQLNPPAMGSVSNRVRLNGRYRANDWLSFEAAYDIVPKVQDRLLETATAWTAILDPGAYRATDLDHRLYPGHHETPGSFTVNQNLDRAFFTVTAPDFDLYVGRQAIAWGSARAVNPTDVIAPYTFDELDSEDRIGVDAVRVRVPIGFMGEIDAGYVAGEDLEWKQSAAFLRGKYYLWRTDISALLVGFRENLMLGLDFTRAIGGAGFWFESAHVFTGALSDDDEEYGEDYFRASIGADYAFGSDTYGFLEYHLNTAGNNHPLRYADILAETPYTEGSVYLMGRHYLIPGVTYQVTPLVSAVGQILWNMSDGSTLLAPSVEYNIAENIYLSAGAYAGIGKGPEVSSEITAGSLPLDIASEFGLYSDVYYTSFRVYF